MLSEIVVFAPAKINLGLKVLPKRQDGFHNLESIFQTVSLADKLTVSEFSGSGCTVTCEDMELPENNTISNTYKAFCSVTGISGFAVKVILEKHIPAGGGLGGGSSDAAAFIRALEKLKGIRLSEKQLDAIASEVGSDVFFFTHCDSAGTCCAVVTGRGEFVRVIKKRRDLYFVMIFPEIHSSTKEAYILVDKLLANNGKIKYPLLGDLEKMYFSPVSEWKFKNTFTEALKLKYPEIDIALQKLRETNALYSEMSGSGSTVFGIYASWEEAKIAAKILNDEGLKCVVTQ